MLPSNFIAVKRKSVEIVTAVLLAAIINIGFAYRDARANKPSCPPAKPSCMANCGGPK